MAKNQTLDIMDRLRRLEVAQELLAQQRVDEAAANGVTLTIEEVQTPTVTNRIIREIPTGVCNGLNVVFVLGNKALYKTEEVFLSGCLLRQGATNDYTIDYAFKTIVMNYAPEPNDVMEVNYDFDINGQ
jgi:hypothetical protein